MKNFMDAYHELLRVNQEDDGEDLGAAMEFQERLAELERFVEEYKQTILGEMTIIASFLGIALPEEKADDFEWTYPYFQKVWGDIMVASERASNIECTTEGEKVQVNLVLHRLQQLTRLLTQYVTLGNINLNKDFDGSQRLWIDMCGLSEVEVEKEHDHG